MKRQSILFLLGTILLFSQPASVFAQKQNKQDAQMIRQIYDETLTKGEAYENLRYLCKNIGGRLSGSPQAAAAVEWGRQLMQSYGFDTVYLQEVMVPHWVRGKKEKAQVLNSKKAGTVDLHVTALGNSVGTGPKGMQAEVIEVKDFDELASLGKDKIAGKIVFFNRPMDQTLIQTEDAYGKAGDQRNQGPAKAAQYGAAGVVVRSLSTAFDDYPHTGGTHYAPQGPQIPAIAISTNDADLLSTMLEEEPDLSFYFETHCQMLPDVLSYNVIGEMKGAKYPNQYIIVGGHLDSWDLAEGAHDDGAGIVQSIEVLRTLKALDYQPQHSIRAVLFMNEENGLAGGRKYAEQARKNGEKHLAAIESDIGGFTPRGFALETGAAEVKNIQSWAPLLQPYDLHKFEAGDSGADISPLKPDGTVLLGLNLDTQRYFDMHHSALDVFEIVNRRELLLGSAAMASMVYLLDQHGVGKSGSNAKSE